LNNRDIAAEVSVDTTPLFAYDRNIFGQFIEHFHRGIYGGVVDPGSSLSDENGFRRDVKEALRQLRTPVVRWPGGSFASGYHWKDGIGPERTATFDRVWRSVEPNTFGTDEFLRWTADIGSEAYICTNAGTGTLDEMSEWVEYCNAKGGTRWADRRASNGSPQAHDVRYWSVGNENYERWELGAEDPVAWARRVTEAAKIMRRVDPSIKLLAASNGDPSWALPMLQSAGQYLDYISVHRYWDQLADINEPLGYEECMAHTLQPERTMDQLIALLQVAGANHISIAFDEWNLRGWHHPEGNSLEALAARDLNDDNSTYTMADAVFTAAFLNACIRHGDRVKMANFAPAVNMRGPLYVHEHGLVKRTTYHVFGMYTSLLESHTLPTTARSQTLETGDENVPVIDVVATGDPKSGNLSIVLINKSACKDSTVQLRMDGSLINAAASVSTLGAHSPDAYNDVHHPETVQPRESTVKVLGGLVTLPPHSISVFRVEGAPNIPSNLDWTIGTHRHIQRSL